MKIKVAFNKLSDFKNKNTRNWLKDNIRVDAEDEVIDAYLLGKEFIVYGIIFWDNSPWYYVCDESDDEYPVPKYSGFFEILDDQLSSQFRLSHLIDENGKNHSALVFKEWAKNKLFYEKLVEGNDHEVSIFLKNKRIINNEFDQNPE